SHPAGLCPILQFQDAVETVGVDMSKPSAKDWPDHVRQDILAQLRNRIGWAEYDQLVASLGEEGVLELLLQQVQGSAVPAQATKSGRQRGLRENWLLLVIVGVVWVLCYFCVLGGRIGEIGL